MANSDLPSSEVRTKPVPQTPGEASFHQHESGTTPELTPFSAYSFSSPDFRQAVRQLQPGADTNAALPISLADSSSTVGAPGIPALLAARRYPGVATAPEIPALLKAQNTPGVAIEPAMTSGKETPAVPIAPAEQMEDTKRTIDPCTAKIVNAIQAPKDIPKALDSVKERDPGLFAQIQAKVTDPRYTGELGNITVSTHDKKGRVNGCVFEQNVPYWESGPAITAMLDVNKVLATKGLKLEADPLNGAGRSLSQEEAIVWRNSGVHAKVGKSNHGFGKAEDFKYDLEPNAKKQLWQNPFVNATLHAHGWRQGDSWGPLKNDLHHWSFNGPGSVTDGHAPPHKHVPAKHHKR